MMLGIPVELGPRAIGTGVLIIGVPMGTLPVGIPLIGMPPGTLLIGKPPVIGATFRGCPLGMPGAGGMGLGTGTSAGRGVSNPAGRIPGSLGGSSVIATGRPSFAER
jgi:hypothetical protein